MRNWRTAARPSRRLRPRLRLSVRRFNRTHRHQSSKRDYPLEAANKGVQESLVHLLISETGDVESADIISEIHWPGLCRSDEEWKFKPTSQWEAGK